jgi:hypothetical protein
MLAEHAKTSAPDVLTSPAPFAFPAAEGGEEDDLITRSPRWIAGRVDHPSPVCGDHSRGGDSLRAMGEPEVQVVDGGGANRDSNGTGSWFGAGALSDSYACRAGRLLVDGSPSLAQNVHCASLIICET